MTSAMCISIGSAATAVAAVVGSVAASGAPALPTRSELLSFERDFLDIARILGGLIEVGLTDEAPGLKRSVRAIESGDLGSKVAPSHHAAWSAALDRIDAGTANLDDAPRLGAARSLLQASVLSYREVARALLRAATSGGSLRGLFLDRAVAAGSRGDDQFDAAASIVQEVRQQLGLPLNLQLPTEAPDVPGVEIIEPGSRKGR